MAMSEFADTKAAPSTDPSISDLQARLDSIVDALLAKKLVEPDCYLITYANRKQLAGNLGYTDYAGRRRSAYMNGTLDECVAQAWAHINALPSPQQVKLDAFQQALGQAIELGKALDLDIPEANFANPLIALMKQLSENALTYQPIDVDPTSFAINCKGEPWNDGFNNTGDSKSVSSRIGSVSDGDIPF